MNIKALKEILLELGVRMNPARDDGWMNGVCPFAPYGGHSSKTGGKQAFHIRAHNKKKSGFNCYVCHRQGSVVDLVNMLGKLRNQNLIKLSNKAQLAESESVTSVAFGEYEMVERPNPILPAQIKGIYKSAWQVPAARNYLARRLISEPTATLLGLLFSGNVGTRTLEHNRIMFPIKDRKGDLYGFSGRDITGKSPAKVQDMMGIKKEFFLLGAEHVTPESKKPILLVEGLFAYASLFEVGADAYGHPVATLGSHISKWQAESLLDWGLPVYMFYDNDAAGHIGIYGGASENGRRIVGAVDLLRGHPTFVPPWPVNPYKIDPKTGQPTPLKDPDELLAETVKLMMDASTALV